MSDIINNNPLTDEEIAIIYEFCDFGDRRKAFRKHHSNKSVSDSAIYRFYKQKKVMDKIIEIGDDLGIYDTVADKILVKVMTNGATNDKDKIAAIKVWNDLRNRVHTTLKIEQNNTIDFTNVTDDVLEKIVGRLKESDSEISNT